MNNQNNNIGFTPEWDKTNEEELKREEKTKEEERRKENEGKKNDINEKQGIQMGQDHIPDNGGAASSNDGENEALRKRRLKESLERFKEQHK